MAEVPPHSTLPVPRSPAGFTPELEARSTPDYRRNADPSDTALTLAALTATGEDSGIASVPNTMLSSSTSAPSVIEIDPQPSASQCEQDGDAATLSSSISSTRSRHRIEQPPLPLPPAQIRGVDVPELTKTQTGWLASDQHVYEPTSAPQASASCPPVPTSSSSSQKVFAQRLKDTMEGFEAAAAAATGQSKALLPRRQPDVRVQDPNLGLARFRQAYTMSEELFLQKRKLFFESRDHESTRRNTHGGEKDGHKLSTAVPEPAYDSSVL